MNPFSLMTCIITILLFLVCSLVCVAEQSELICSHQPIVALAGDDVILPCYLDPPISASSETVVWTRPGLDPKYIHVHHNGRLVYETQNPSYFLRTRLFVDELQNGNVSMKIFKVKISDAGKYFCFLRSMLKKASIQLTVGKSDFLKMMNYTFLLTAKISNSSDWILIITIIPVCIIVLFIIIILTICKSHIYFPFYSKLLSELFIDIHTGITTVTKQTV
uniref:Ig-like domain-containing protein n=1 Tax=Dicentrarchus labrax TaxID=13489 RepID=A0A8P4KHY7_DICLA